MRAGAMIARAITGDALQCAVGHRGIHAQSPRGGKGCVSRDRLIMRETSDRLRDGASSGAVGRARRNDEQSHEQVAQEYPRDWAS